MCFSYDLRPVHGDASCDILLIMQATYELSSLEATLQLGAAIGARLKGGEVLELSGDIGAGKTSFVKGVGRGLAIGEVIQSPTFTISRVYKTPGNITLYHYDFYRLNEAGIMRDELAESLEDPSGVVALEWDDTVRDILPGQRTMRFAFIYIDEHSRRLLINVPDNLMYALKEEPA